MLSCEVGVSEEDNAPDFRPGSKSAVAPFEEEGNVFASGAFVIASGSTTEFLAEVGIDISKSGSDIGYWFGSILLRTPGCRKSTTSNACPSMTSPRTAFRLPAFPSRAIAADSVLRSAFGHPYLLQVPRNAALPQKRRDEDLPDLVLCKCCLEVAYQSFLAVL